MITVNNLTKYYGDLAAVAGISFNVTRGEVLGLLGPNAAGKTTTMRMLSCFVPASSGEAHVAGFDVYTHPVEVRRRIGYMPENVPLYDDMRVSEYLTYRARLKEVASSRFRQRLDYVYERCKIGDVSSRIVGQLSRGYKQRVGLAACLIHDPEVLILDEPTIGLDPHQIRETRQLIRDLGSERTVLLSTHILPEVEMVCGRVLIINKGKIVAMDTPVNLTRRLHGGSALSLEVKGTGREVEKAVKKVRGVASVTRSELDGSSRFRVESGSAEDLREAVSRAATGAGGIILEMKQELMSLEDIFIKITTSEEGD